MFIRYAEVGDLPVGAAVSTVRSNLKRRELLTKLPVLSLSVLVLVIAVAAVLTSLLPTESSQMIVDAPAVKIAPVHVDTAPLDVGLAPNDLLSASNSLAPSVAAYRWRRHRFHRARSQAFAEGWSDAGLKDDVNSREQPMGLGDGYAEPQSGVDAAPGAD